MLQKLTLDQIYYEEHTVFESFEILQLWSCLKCSWILEVFGVSLVTNAISLSMIRVGITLGTERWLILKGYPSSVYLPSWCLLLQFIPSGEKETPGFFRTSAVVSLVLLSEICFRVTARINSLPGFHPSPLYRTLVDSWGFLENILHDR